VLKFAVTTVGEGIQRRQPPFLFLCLELMREGYDMIFFVLHLLKPKHSHLKIRSRLWCEASL